MAGQGLPAARTAVGRGAAGKAAKRAWQGLAGSVRRPSRLDWLAAPPAGRAQRMPPAPGQFAELAYCMAACAGFAIGDLDARLPRTGHLIPAGRAGAAALSLIRSAGCGPGTPCGDVPGPRRRPTLREMEPRR